MAFFFLIHPLKRSSVCVSMCVCACMCMCVCACVYYECVLPLLTGLGSPVLKGAAANCCDSACRTLPFDWLAAVLLWAGYFGVLNGGHVGCWVIL